MRSEWLQSLTGAGCPATGASERSNRDPSAVCPSTITGIVEHDTNRIADAHRRQVAPLHHSPSGRSGIAFEGICFMASSA
jgi:hypothetical protein